MLVRCDPYGHTTARAKSRAAIKRPATVTIDIHCHLMTPAAAELARPHFDSAEQPFVKFASQLTRDVTHEQYELRREHLTGVEHRLRDMDDMLVDIQVVSPAPAQYYYWADPELGRELSRTINDNIAEQVSREPERLLGFGTIPLQHTELALDELHRCVRDLGFRGVEIGTEVNDEELSSPRLEPFWQRCEELGVVVFIHPMGYTEAGRLREHFFSNVIANPLATTVAVHYLIFDGVMDRHPGLKVVLSHGGGYLAHYPGRIDHAHGARPDCCTRIADKPTEYLKRFYFDTVVFRPDQVEYLARLYGSDHILLGTDYPFDLAEYDPVELVDQVASFSADDKAKVCGLNAARLLGLSSSGGKRIGETRR